MKFHKEMSAFSKTKPSQSRAFVKTSTSICRTICSMSGQDRKLYEEKCFARGIRMQAIPFAPTIHVLKTLTGLCNNGYFPEIGETANRKSLSCSLMGCY